MSTTKPEVLPITGDWPEVWCDYFAEKWKDNFELVTGKALDLTVTQRTQAYITDFEFMRQMQSVARPLICESPDILMIGSAGGTNAIGCLFDNRRVKRIFCVDFQEDSEVDVMCTNIRNYIHLFSGRGEAHEGFTVEDNRKHRTRQSYRDDDKL
jgi:hypothetical protein